MRLAQERTTTGTVTSTEDGFPLPAVSIKALGSRATTTTGNDGKFSI